mgnify:CR=1 FL=1
MNTKEVVALVEKLIELTQKNTISCCFETANIYTSTCIPINCCEIFNYSIIMVGGCC